MLLREKEDNALRNVWRQFRDFSGVGFTEVGRVRVVVMNSSFVLLYNWNEEEDSIVFRWLSQNPNQTKRFPAWQHSLHINVLELKAVYLAILAFTKYTHIKTIRDQIDNMAVFLEEL